MIYSNIPIISAYTWRDSIFPSSKPPQEKKNKKRSTFIQLPTLPTCSKRRVAASVSKRRNSWDFWSGSSNPEIDGNPHNGLYKPPTKIGWISFIPPWKSWGEFLSPHRLDDMNKTSWIWLYKKILVNCTRIMVILNKLLYLQKKNNACDGVKLPLSVRPALCFKDRFPSYCSTLPLVAHLLVSLVGKMVIRYSFAQH